MVVTVKRLSVWYERQQPILRDVNFSLRAGERVALIGDSGAGKSTLARALCGLLPAQSMTDGAVRYYGNAPHAGYIFQNPYNCLNPALTIENLFREQLQARQKWHRPSRPASDRHTPDRPDAHRLASRPASRRLRRAQYRQEAIALLHRLDFDRPEEQLKKFPHQLSRGMCQRVVIALNMIVQPRLLICDEPTSALDLNAEQQVCRILNTIAMASAVLFITHNIRLALAMCERIMVVDDGRIVDDFSIAQLRTGDMEANLSQHSERTQAYMRAANNMLNRIDSATPAEREAPHETPPTEPETPPRAALAHTVATPVPPPALAHTSTTPAPPTPQKTPSPAVPDIPPRTAPAHTVAIPTPPPAPSPTPPELMRLDNICFAYRSRSPWGTLQRFPDILRDISLTIHQRDAIGIFGKSGSGKSTLLKVMIALLSPHSGTLLFEGRAITRSNKAKTNAKAHANANAKANTTNLAHRKRNSPDSIAAKRQSPDGIAAIRRHVQRQSKGNIAGKRQSRGDIAGIAAIRRHAQRQSRDGIAAIRRHVQMIFQDPAQSLSPLHTIEHIIGEPLRLQRPRAAGATTIRAHEGATARRETTTTQRGSASITPTSTAIRARVRTLMDEVHLSHTLLHRYPHQLSVGQQQRTLIARALALSPTLLLADEPFSALDSPMQVSLLSLFRQLQHDRAISILIVSHRPEILSAACDRQYQLHNHRLQQLPTTHQTAK